MKGIYEKYRSGDALTDQEVIQGVFKFERMLKDLEELPSEFSLAAGEIRRVLYSFRDFANARGLNIEPEEHHQHPPLDWAVLRCRALMDQGFDTVRLDVLEKTFMNAIEASKQS